jgi:hypothetical protein
VAIQDQVNAILGQQGRSRIEHDLLHSAVDVDGAKVTTEGMNFTRLVLLENGTQAFHKPFRGVHVRNAGAYGHHPDQVPINECAAWRLAAAIGEPISSRVAVCVMWNPGDRPGSLTRRARGEAETTDPFLDAPEQCRDAAFFDSVIGQQDRHLGNLRWISRLPRLTLYDHGYAFPLPGHYLGSTAFVEWRWTRRETRALVEWEIDALTRLISDPALLGLSDILLPDRSAALKSRAQRMLQRRTILMPGDF